MSEIFILQEPAYLRQEVKKSIFITHAKTVISAEEAFAFLEQVAEPEATHNCWAYQLGSQYRFSDDGEPGGTAGRPILNAIQKQGIDRVMVIVIRYFGGIMLGAGGLVRAYGGAANECLRNANKSLWQPWLQSRIDIQFNQINDVIHLLEDHQGKRLQEEYHTQGVGLQIAIPAATQSAFEQDLRNITRGSAQIAQWQEWDL